jgi:pimeloyl-ACP methyl ester carboxylesterase
VYHGCDCGPPSSTMGMKVEQGGHFAAWEQPQIFAAEMRSTFRSLR